MTHSAAAEPKEDNNNLAAFPKKAVDEDAAAMDLFRKTKSLFGGAAPMPQAPPPPPSMAPRLPAPSPPGQHLPDVVSSPMFPGGGVGPGAVSPLRSAMGPPPPNAAMAAAIARLPFLADQVNEDYRVTHVVGENLLLTWVLKVPSSCLGSK